MKNDIFSYQIILEIYVILVMKIMLYKCIGCVLDIRIIAGNCFGVEICKTVKNGITEWVSGLPGVRYPNSELVTVRAAHELPKHYWSWSGQTSYVLVGRFGQKRVLCHFAEKHFRKSFTMFLTYLCRYLISKKYV